MKRKPAAEISVALATARRQFEQWRRQHPHPKRLPEELWEKATVLARQHGINPTARVLGLNYDALKWRLKVRTADASSSPPGVQEFLELVPGALATPPVLCTIELNDGRGATLRLHVQGVTMADLAAFAARWRSDQP
jgi:hypothetical protein